MSALLDAGSDAVGLLAGKLPSETSLDEERIRRLIAELDDDAYEAREQATSELIRIVDLAEPYLREALSQAPSAEAQMRLERALAALSAPATAPWSADERAMMRALALLEAAGTPEAWEAIRDVAKSSAPSRIRRQASEAIGRRR